MGQNVLLKVIDQAYDRRSWHGTNLRGSLRRISVAQASWRPGPKRHNIWEIVVHAAYWKYAVWRRVTGAKRGSFELKGSNWFVRPALAHRSALRAGGTEAAWRADLALLERMHKQLRAAAAALTPAQLSRSSPGTAFNNAELLSGIAAHDLYHAGQIQLLKKLATSQKLEARSKAGNQKNAREQRERARANGAGHGAPASERVGGGRGGEAPRR